ncbi:ABC transporter ATP-binding protein [Paenibacillus tarimensis]|uniref:ABC transporter ATP-binding protein n=1 Tax=Paenibacillus tarimensis TaxID=416012 RepID=UPI001F21FDFA|nr:ATP-binding cassette domain-containing protein [Paenibacillus tarimensis]MCF2942895.1 ATP-binding cassette domain-containing protein [Paenibacillus tarimensis]
MTPVLELHQLAKLQFDEKEEYLFRPITSKVAKGDRIAVVGASGQGKSTLLRILARLERQDEGYMSLGGVRDTDWKPAEWRKKVCYTAQHPVMLPGTVEDNLRTVSRLHSLPFDESAAKEYMSQIGLGDMDWRKEASSLSGGEKQRVALVRSLLLEPEVLLLDEFTASLDPGSREGAEMCVRQWADTRNSAVLLISHDMEQAERMCRTVWFMSGGELLEAADAGRFFAAPETESAKQFLQRSLGEGRAGNV